jgi:hypothetical protein
VVHVEKIEGIEDPDRGFAVQLLVLLKGSILRNDGADNGCGGQTYKQKNGKLQRTEKIPQGIDKTSFSGFQEDSPERKNGDSWEKRVSY